MRRRRARGLPRLYAALGVACAVLGLLLAWRTVGSFLEEPAPALGGVGSGPSPLPPATPTPERGPGDAIPALPATDTGAALPAPRAPEEGAGPGTARDGARPLAGAVVVVDPGHNGANAEHPLEISRPVDAGGFLKACNTTGTATDDGYAESTFTWAVAQRLRDELERLGARVVLTRDDDTSWGPCVDERGLTAQREHADLLLSVHADGASPGGHGFHVIAPALVRGYTDGVVEPSAALARDVRAALVERAGLSPATYVGQDGLDVRADLGTLNRAGAPAVIVECGNLRNARDAARLTGEAGQAAIAEALAAAAVAFLTS